MSMIYSQMNPLLIDQLIVLISAAFMDYFSADEQEIIGAFLTTLGTVISFNSLYIEGQTTNQQSDKNEQKDDQDNTNEDNNYELLKKSIEKIQEQMKNIKKEKSQSQ
jgi:hypothetical protein